MDRKDHLRKELKAARAALSREEVRIGSERIAQTLIANIITHPPGRMLAYEPHGEWNEVDTSAIVRLIKDQFPGVDIFVVDNHSGATMPAGEFDYVLVPTLGFDECCNRIGLGAGWYDKFLVTQPRAVKIGLAYEVSRVDQIPVEVHDIPLDYVITERKIYTPTSVV